MTTTRDTATTKRRGLSRRAFLKTTAGTAALLGAVQTKFPAGVHIAEAAGPEVTKANLGFIALTDAAPLFIAKEKGFFAKHGMPGTEVMKQASWGATRDNLVLGSEGNGIDGAHILTPMPYLITAGKVTQNNVPTPMYILARLQLDSQCISVAKEYMDLKVGVDSTPLKAAFEKKKASGKSVKAANTFPGGTHDLWIRYWLAAGGIDPDKDIETITVPPPQMVANMKVGTMDCFCVCEPWNVQLVHQGIGYTAINTGELWNKHPEKSLGMRAAWVDKYPKAAQAVLMAVMEAQQWCDKPENHEELATIMSKRQWINAPVADILDRTKGKFDYGIPGRWSRTARSIMKFWMRFRLLSVQEPRAVVRHRGHPLGQVRAGRRCQGADQEGQPRGHLARGGEGAQSSRPRKFRRRPRAARRPSSTARSSIRKTRAPISRACDQTRRNVMTSGPPRGRPVLIRGRETLHEHAAGQGRTGDATLPPATATVLPLEPKRPPLSSRIATRLGNLTVRVVPPVVVIALTLLSGSCCAAGPADSAAAVTGHQRHLGADRRSVLRSRGRDMGSFWHLLASLQRVAIG